MRLTSRVPYAILLNELSERAAPVTIVAEYDRRQLRPLSTPTFSIFPPFTLNSTLDGIISSLGRGYGSGAVAKMRR